MRIFYEDIKDKTLSQVEAILTKHKTDINKLKLSDLTLYGPGNGVYAFWYENECEYVGKASSRSMVERIPSHFDTRERAWMNSYPKAVIRNCPKISNCEKAVKRCLDSSLFMIIFKEPTNNDEYCRHLEKVIKFILRPKLKGNKLGERPRRILEKNLPIDSTLHGAIEELVRVLPLKPKKK